MDMLLQPNCDCVVCIFTITSCSTSDVPVLPVDYNYSLKAQAPNIDPPPDAFIHI